LLQMITHFFRSLMPLYRRNSPIENAGSRTWTCANATYTEGHKDHMSKRQTQNAKTAPHGPTPSENRQQP